MAAATQADFAATTSWQNLVASNGATASVAIALRNKGDGTVRVVWGGSIPTAEDAGDPLAAGECIVTDGAAAIWLRTEGGTDKVGVTLL